jgi:hypothetical protein
MLDYAYIMLDYAYIYANFGIISLFIGMVYSIWFITLLIWEYYQMDFHLLD